MIFFDPLISRLQLRNTIQCLLHFLLQDIFLRKINFKPKINKTSLNQRKQEHSELRKIENLGHCNSCLKYVLRYSSAFIHMQILCISQVVYCLLRFICPIIATVQRVECYREDLLTELTKKRNKFRTEILDNGSLPQFSRLQFNLQNCTSIAASDKEILL